MKRAYFILQLLLFNVHNPCNALAQFADSVITVLEEKNHSDQQKLESLLAFVKKTVLTQGTRSIKLIQHFEPILQSATNQNTKAELYRHKGLAHNLLGEKDSAAFYYNKAKSIHQRAGNPLGVGDCLLDLARMNRKLKNLEEAIRYYDEAETIFRKLGNEAKIAEVLNESGVAYEYKKDYNEAIKRYSASLAIQQKRRDTVGIGYSLEFLGGVYNLTGAYQQSEKYLFEALQYRIASKDTFATALNYTAIGDLYSKMKRTHDALTFYTLSNDFSKKISYTDLQMYTYGELATLLQKQGNYPKAMEYLQLHLQLKDSLNNAKKLQQLSELNVEYETEKNKAVIQAQRLDLLQRNFWIAGIGTLFLLATIMFYAIWRSNKLKHAARLQQEILHQQELTTQAVLKAEEEERQRIARDLHDGVGQMLVASSMNLSALSSMVKLESHEGQLAFQKINQLLHDSVKEVRAVSHNMMANALLKNSLAAAIREFIDKLDHKKLQVQLYTQGLDQRLSSDIETVFYRIIQECVNNVVKHADADKLHISITKEEEGISAMIEDNGKGFDSRNPNKYEGIGLKNIMTRVAYLKGTVDFDSAPGKGTLVAIFIPHSS